MGGLQKAARCMACEARLGFVVRACDVKVMGMMALGRFSEVKGFASRNAFCKMLFARCFSVCLGSAKIRNNLRDEFDVHAVWTDQLMSEIRNWAFRRSAVLHLRAPDHCNSQILHNYLLVVRQSDANYLQDLNMIAN